MMRLRNLRKKIKKLPPNGRSINDVLESALEECKVDHVGLWWIVSDVKEIVPKGKVKETTLTIITKLLESKTIIAGNFQKHPSGDPFKNEFERFDQPIEAVIDYIKLEWIKLNRDPDIGEIVWFTAL